jgi:hypothetical protein
MAKVKIQGHASGTGILTVTAPNTSTDRTITLPDATGTLLNSDGSAASLTAIPAANITGTLPAIDGGSLTGITTGKVLQVIQTHITATSSQSIGSGSTITNITSLSATITPSSTSSKILVMVRWCGVPAANRWEQVFGINRGSTALGIVTAGNRRAGLATVYESNAGWTAAGVDGMYATSYQYLDSPSTTSATTYYAYVNPEGTGTMYNNRGVNDTDAGYTERGTSMVIVMEIGA